MEKKLADSSRSLCVWDVPFAVVTTNARHFGMVALSWIPQRM